jgi:hypothetical protein
MKEAEVVQIGREATVYVAKLLSVPYCEFYDTLELQKHIKERDIELHEKLNDFIQAYWRFYFFVCSLSKGNLKKEEMDLLTQRGKEKDEIRKILINFLETKIIK